VEIAEDDSHGYDQAHRYGPDDDCSSLVISIYTLLGVDLQATYTGNMEKDFLAHGFRNVTKEINLKSGNGLIPGDVLLYHDHVTGNGHTAISVGGGKIVAARINEKGTATGGSTGDQTGNEICVQNYYNFPWLVVLRYADEIEVTDAEVQLLVTNFPWVRKGAKGPQVAAVQAALWYEGYFTERTQIDGECGIITDSAIRAFQKCNGLDVDGIAGDETLTALFN